MKKVRTIINVALGSMIAALGLSSCDNQVCLYGPDPGLGADTTVRVMYGVTPTDGDFQESNYDYTDND